MKVDWQDIRVGGYYQFKSKGEWVTGKLMEIGNGRYRVAPLNGSEELWVLELHYAATIGYANDE